MQCIFYILNHFLLQVVDIVRTNVRAILQRVWRASEVDNLRLCRVFSRVFNRLLWSHGQGLWNCFSNLGYVALWVMYTYNKSNLVSRAFSLAPFPTQLPSQRKGPGNEVAPSRLMLQRLEWALAWTACHLYQPKAVETLIHLKHYGYYFFIVCKIYFLCQKLLKH